VGAAALSGSFLAQAGSVKAAWSRSAHQRVTRRHHRWGYEYRRSALDFVLRFCYTVYQIYSATWEVENMDSTTVQMAKRGVITIPQPLREAYGMQPGDTFTLMDLGGVFVLSPRRSEIDVLAERIHTQWTEKGATLETMLQALREERDRRGR
jgi:bifunctional DNA-binding transcriptional regulator/antitoxin component of YhaV-PrlF toxin-antitoxin module